MRDIQENETTELSDCLRLGERSDCVAGQIVVTTKEYLTYYKISLEQKSAQVTLKQPESDIRKTIAHSHIDSYVTLTTQALFQL